MRVFMAAVSMIAAFAHHSPNRGCQRTFTIPMVIRSVDHVYAGTRDVTRRERRRLHHEIHCARRPTIRPALVWYWRRAARRWRHRRAATARPAPAYSHALASWYYTQGAGACGLPGGAQFGLRFASLILPCGAQVQFCHAGRCATATMADRGPYVAGRTFDLNLNLRDALACGGLCEVAWRRVGQ